jgi:hypothetical protein
MATLWRACAGAWLCLTLGSAVAFAQSTAQINGIVRDDSGGVLPGATVTATQTATGFERSAVTDAEGAYTLPNLPLGPYRLEVALAGFRTYAQTGITLQVNANPVINVTLSLGQVSETVAVEAAAPLVETRTTGISQVVENERIVALPLNGRNPVDLIVLAGAAVGGQVGTSTGRMQGSQGISVAGGQGFGVAYQLDGATHNNPYDNLNLPLPFPDALQEFRVETSGLAAQHGGHSGASVNAVTRSGTNIVHGSVFEFVRDRRFNATNPFAGTDAAGERADDGLNRNQFGGTFGGPLRRDRVFFFGAYQGTRNRQVPADNTAFVPTAAMLAGDFTTAASPACNAGRQVLLRGPFVNNRVDTTALSRAAVAITGKLPTTTDPCGRVVYGLSNDADEKQAIGRADLQLTSNHSMFGRYMATTFFQDPPNSKSSNILTSITGGQDHLAQSFTYGDTLVVSPSAVNAIRFAFNRTSVQRTHVETFEPKDVGINTYSYLPHYSLFMITNAFTLGGNSRAVFDTNTYQINDDVTIVRGSHQWGFGANVAWWQSFSSANIRSPGVFTFDGQVTGLPLADFLTGNLAQFRQVAPNVLDTSQWYTAVYAQDTWRLSPKVTLNYGLRWEPYLPQVIDNAYVFTFDPERFRQNIRSKVFTNAPAGFLYPGDDGFIGKSGIRSQWLNAAPRAGIAWDPAGDGRMSIRSSYGLSYDYPNGRVLITTALAPPWGSEVIIPVPAGGLEDPFRGIAGGNPFPTAENPGPEVIFPTGGQFIAPLPDANNPLVHAWNVGVQRQLGTDIALGVSYIGNYTQHLWNPLPINPGVYIPGGPCTLADGRTYNPCSTAANTNVRRLLSAERWSDGQKLGAVDVHDDRGSQKYTGFLFSFQRRAAQGVSLSGNYTWSKCTGTPTQAGSTPNAGTGYANPNDIEYDRGPCDSDRRHITNLTVGYETPSFGDGLMSAIASGWRMAGIVRATSGTWLNITVTGDPARNGQTVQRPNRVLDDPYGDKSWNNYLNPAAFAQPAVGTFGNLPRNAVEGPGRWSIDASLVRAFGLGAANRIELRVEAFNLLNTSQLGNPVTNLNSPTFGRILSAGDPRIMQFAVKYTF